MRRSQRLTCVEELLLTARIEGGSTAALAPRVFTGGLGEASPATSIRGAEIGHFETGRSVTRRCVESLYQASKRSVLAQPTRPRGWSNLSSLRVKRQGPAKRAQRGLALEFGTERPAGRRSYLAHYRASSVKLASEATNRRQLLNSLLVLITDLIWGRILSSWENPNLRASAPARSRSKLSRTGRVRGKR